MEETDVDSNIPIPEVTTRGGRSKYPWVTMNVGDSFFVPDIHIAKFSGQAVNAAKRFKTKYTCRTVDGGVRVWRVK